MSPPIVVIGMHRSGTSLLTRLLAQLGLFVGWELNHHFEALFFVLRNQRLLRDQGASWHNPTAGTKLLPEGVERRRLVAALAEEVRSAATVSYLGPRRYVRWGSLLRLPFPWGWKDPRNTLVLPLWLEIFPGARVVHIVRNGVDVAMSLALRERLRPGWRARAGSIPAVLRPSTPPEGVGWLAWRWSLFRLALLSGPGSRRGVDETSPLLDLENGFELWTQYLEQAQRASRLVESGVLELRYEDLVSAPASQLRRLVAHCRLAVRPGQVETAAAQVRRDARDRFRTDTAAAALYEEVRGNEWMQRWCYDRC